MIDDFRELAEEMGLDGWVEELEAELEEED